MKLKFVVLASILISAQFCRAQNFNLMRFDEDYSALKDSLRTLENKIKYAPLGQSSNAYLSFGGEVRTELDLAYNEDWGLRNASRDIFLLRRYQLNADLHLGSNIRLFVQLRSGLENGRKNGPRPMDEDQLNFQNLFIDLVPYKREDRNVILRLGRQEIQYGSGRLLDVREGPNLRLYFDGAKVSYTSPSLTVDGFLFAADKIRTGIFDNPKSRRAGLWGIYSTWSGGQVGNFDLYYLGIDRIKSQFDEGVANESRHTFGARFWKNGNGFIFNFEGGYQLGDFGRNKIRAWGGSSDIGYAFGDLKGSPKLSLRSDFISGDNMKGDGKLGSFNGLYPNGGYFGMNPQVGPGNLLSIHPKLSWSPCKGITLSPEVVFNWRQSLRDGIYRPDGTFNLSSSGSSERYIGAAYITSASWVINRSLNFNLGIQYFQTGAFINDIIPKHKDGFFVGSVIGYKI